MDLAGQVKTVQQAGFIYNLYQKGYQNNCVCGGREPCVPGLPNIGSQNRSEYYYFNYNVQLVAQIEEFSACNPQIANISEQQAK